MTIKTDQNRRDGRATIYLQPSLKAWLEQNSKDNGRSFSSQVTYILEQWAKTNGYVEPEPELPQTVAPTTEDILLKLAELLKGAAHASAYCFTL